MSIVIGYVPTPEGSAALDFAIAEAHRSSRTLVVVNSSRGEALLDRSYAAIPEIDGIEHRLSQEGSNTSSCSQCVATTPQTKSWTQRKNTKPS